MQPPELFVDDGAGTCAGRLNVQSAVLDCLLYLFGPDVVVKERHRAAAVREEVDAVSDPHGLEVVRIFARHFFDLPALERRDPYGCRLPASIPFPRLKGARERDIGKAR